MKTLRIMIPQQSKQVYRIRFLRFSCLQFCLMLVVKKLVQDSSLVHEVCLMLSSLKNACRNRYSTRSITQVLDQKNDLILFEKLLDFCIQTKLRHPVYQHNAFYGTQSFTIQKLQTIKQRIYKIRTFYNNTSWLIRQIQHTWQTTRMPNASPSPSECFISILCCR